MIFLKECWCLCHGKLKDRKDKHQTGAKSQILRFKARGGNKKVNGRKRHILVDVKGRIYQTHIHASNLDDSPQWGNLLKFKVRNYEGLKKIMGDKSYRGTFAEGVEKMGLEFAVLNFFRMFCATTG